MGYSSFTACSAYVHRVLDPENFPGGGMYSLANLPVQGYVELERKGTLVSQDSKRKMYEVQDNEKVFVKRVVPFDKVSNIEEVDE